MVSCLCLKHLCASLLFSETLSPGLWALCCSPYSSLVALCLKGVAPLSEKTQVCLLGMEETQHRTQEAEPPA